MSQLNYSRQKTTNVVLSFSTAGFLMSNTSGLLQYSVCWQFFVRPVLRSLGYSADRSYRRKCVQVNPFLCLGPHFWSNTENTFCHISASRGPIFLVQSAKRVAISYLRRNIGSYHTYQRSL